MRLRSVAFAAASFTLVAAAMAAPVVRYHAIDLQALPGTPQDSGGYGIASNGFTAGSSYLSSEGVFRAVRNAGGGIENLGGLGASASIANGINASGTAVGFALLSAQGPAHATSFSGGTVTDLFAGSSYSSSAHGINDSGQIIGTFDHYFDGYGGAITAAFRLTGSTLLELGPLAGNYAAGSAINEAGQVVGESTVVAGSARVHGFFYDGSTMHDIGGLSADFNSHAYAINDLGQVVGSATADNGQTHAVLYQNGALTDLGLFAGSDYSSATGINDSGLIVGTAGGSNGMYGWLFDGQQFIDLSTLISDGFNGWQLTALAGINDAGQIVGTAITGDGINHAFRFDPFEATSNVPEPGSMALALAALGALLMAARFRPRASGGVRQAGLYSRDSERPVQ